MEPIALKGIKRLKNNVILINNESLKQLVDYLGVQTTAINMLIAELDGAKSEISRLSKIISTNSNNIKNIAIALEGAYKDD